MVIRYTKTCLLNSGNIVNIICIKGNLEKRKVMSKKIQQIPLSILELAMVTEGSNAKQALQNALDLAQKAEAMGYLRFWLAEHHNMQGVASTATSVLIGYIAGGTKTIRVGSGGIMLPNHAPFVVAEQFGTLGTLYPNRIDLGLGRAPGTDQHTVRALRRDNMGAIEFPQNVKEVQTYLSAENCTALVRAFPGEGVDIPLWILGSSTDSAYLAAAMGLPYVFASHFAPPQLHEAIQIYRQNFEPSSQLSKPYIMAAINVIAADSNEEAATLATSLKQQFIGIITGERRLLQPPYSEKKWDLSDFPFLKQMLSCSFVGDKEKIKAELQHFLDITGVDELMISSPIYDHEARIKSYEILKSIQAG